ncbi:phosphate/phosphite/phosphonate ABC transporter substrate-binding protein [Pelagibacterium lentulum]|uniref:Phosphonate ABC transporter substrate-binding protein n=1 Tax=Pelagibacterium lentulum TaxID=2029865 RepID=A0A916RMP8_9HYPH|nr:phosphate/phosphite/phosphonate ABC transporter substrate-binding protein [Pelagibacterium lentulum]GGA62336.1 phosphonate ABC transporter substrate-binding protein [Pelagibacterium lentulum]
MMRRIGIIASLVVGVGLVPAAQGQDNHDCRRGADLATPYCDRNNDLVADLPLDPAQWRNPPTLVWAYAPIEDPAVYAELFKPFTNHLEECLGRQIVYYPVQSIDVQIDALRTGRLHFAGFSTGSTVEAVNTAGAVPFAAKGIGDEMRGYRLVAVVRADSPFQTLAELEGRRVAHASPLSNSGNLAPRALFPAEGLVPDVDYTPIMSGSHDRSLQGVIAGDYDMAAVASDILERLVERGLIAEGGLRVLYESALFPTSSFVHAHDLDPALSEALKQCFFDFTFPSRLKAEFNGDTNFVPLDYRQAWATVREVMSRAETMID